MRKLCLVITILVLALSVRTGAQGNSPEPIERAHFIYYLDNPRYASLVDTVLDRTRSQLINQLHDSLSYRPSVYITGDLTRFEQLVGGYFPDWGAAAAAPARRLIAIKSPEQFNINRSLPELLAHEYAHLALAHRCKLGTPPRWFDEGLSMMVSMEWSWSDNLAMSKGAVFGQFIPLREIERVNRFNESKAHLAYAQSYLAVKYLFDEYGVDAVNTFLDSVAAGRSYDIGLSAATGSDYDGFEAEFLMTLRKRFNVLSLFMDTIYLWIALAIVVIVGGILNIRKRSRYYREWDEYEKLHSTDFDYGDPENPEEPDDDEPWCQ